MISVRKIDYRDNKIINDVVNIHMETFTGFFLTFMGCGFLKQMYSSYTLHKDSGLLVAFDGDKVIGFLAYSTNISGLYKYMIKHKLVGFAWYSFGAFFRKPKVFMKLVRAFLKPSETKRDEQYVELASIGVSPRIKSKGVGTLLVDELKNHVDFSKYDYITLETDADNNEGANHFYQKNGFIVEREFLTHEGRRMLEYRYKKQFFVCQK